jgi:hypothetical protein
VGAVRLVTWREATVAATVSRGVRGLACGVYAPVEGECGLSGAVPVAVPAAPAAVFAGVRPVRAR